MGPRTDGFGGFGGSCRPPSPAARLAPLAIAVPLLTMALAGCIEEESPYGSKVGDQAHPFTLTTIDNETVSLASLTSNGTILVLDLMGVNCGPCRAQTRELVKWHDGYNTSGIHVLSVDLGDQIGSLGAESEADIVEFRDEFGAQWRFAEDTVGLMQNYQVIAFPTLYIIGPDGTILLKETSVKTAEDFDATVRPLME